jgi:hypothetical protein
MVNFSSFLVAALFMFHSVSSQGATCFCKALCYYGNVESSDFMLSEDVPCELSLADKKSLLESKLKDHFREVHGYQKEMKFKESTKITCFESKKEAL